MNEILAIGLQSMHGDMARLEQVGMNLANALTTGYKRGVAVQGPVGGSFAAQLASLEGASADPTAATAPARLEALSDTRAGTLKFTGQALDMALGGNGYFEVITESGPAYTRNGSFHVDARGRLVNEKGHAVIGTGGEITLGGAAPTIDANGSVLSSASDEARLIARLKVVEFDKGAMPQRLGDGLFAAAGVMRQLDEGEVQVRQGYLENSNVSSTTEMTQLIQTMRHFETMQKVVQGYDDMLGSAIRKLGES